MKCDDFPTSLDGIYKLQEAQISQCFTKRCPVKDRENEIDRDHCFGLHCVG